MSLAMFLSFYRYPPEWMVWILKNMKTRALARGAAAVVAHCDEAMPVVEAALDLEQQYKNDRAAAATGAVELDRTLFTDVRLVHDSLEAWANAGPAVVHGAEAKAALADAFPEGLAPLFRATLVRKAATYPVVLRALRKPAHGVVVDWLRLAPTITRIGEQSEQLSALIAAQDAVSWDDVQAASGKALDATIEVIYSTIGALRSSRPADVELREHLLRPVVVANETLHDLFSSRAKARPASQPACEDNREPAGKALDGEAAKETNKVEVPAPPVELAAK